MIPETFNPYESLFDAVGGDGRRADNLLRDAPLAEYDAALDGTFRRYDWALVFAWSVPNDAALRTIAAEKRILEVGAGTGYWTWLLRKLDVDVVATDRHDEDNHWNGTVWTEVEKLDAAEAARRYGDDRTLLIVWPPMSSMASETLAAYRGDTVVYVGEGYGGCTGDGRFFDELRRGWKLRTAVELPQWFGTNDRLFVYDRIYVGRPQNLDPKRLEGT